VQFLVGIGDEVAHDHATQSGFHVVDIDGHDIAFPVLVAGLAAGFSGSRSGFMCWLPLWLCRLRFLQLGYLNFLSDLLRMIDDALHCFGMGVASPTCGARVDALAEPAVVDNGQHAVEFAFVCFDVHTTIRADQEHGAVCHEAAHPFTSGDAGGVMPWAA
jgi:hypothetical protein